MLLVTSCIPFSAVPMITLAFLKCCTLSSQISLLTSANWIFFSLTGVYSEEFFQKELIAGNLFEPCMSEKCLFFALTINLDIEV